MGRRSRCSVMTPEFCGVTSRTAPSANLLGATGLSRILEVLPFSSPVGSEHATVAGEILGDRLGLFSGVQYSDVVYTAQLNTLNPSLKLQTRPQYASLFESQRNRAFPGITSWPVISTAPMVCGCGPVRTRCPPGAPGSTER
jgi:hypothetical protein